MEVLQQYAAYAAREQQRAGTTKFTRSIIKPAQNLFTGVKNGKLFRKLLDGNVQGKMDAAEALLRAAECFSGVDTSVMAEMSERDV
jgi:hypothetical protein